VLERQGLTGSLGTPSEEGRRFHGFRTHTLSTFGPAATTKHIRHPAERVSLSMANAGALLIHPSKFQSSHEPRLINPASGAVSGP
jgi:hypothetical protein